MTTMNNDKAVERAEQYRDQVVTKLRALGHVVTNLPGWNNEGVPDAFMVQGEPKVQFDLLAQSAQKHEWSSTGCPDLVFRPGYGSNRRPVHWREPDRGWDEKSAEKHAAVLDKSIQECRAAQTAAQTQEVRRASLEQQADEMNKRVGIASDRNVPFRAGHSGSRVVLQFQNYYLGVPEGQVEAVLRDLQAVLVRHGVK